MDKINFASIIDLIHPKRKEFKQLHSKADDANPYLINSTSPTSTLSTPAANLEPRAAS